MTLPIFILINCETDFKSIVLFLTLSAGGALATALMFVEFNQSCNGSNHISLEDNTC